jgi:ligand-binding sensor domain-containing protein
MNDFNMTEKKHVSRIKYYLTWVCLTVILLSMGFLHPVSSQTVKETGITAKKYSSVVVDDKNTKWFTTELGLVSFDGVKWILHNQNKNIPAENLNHLAFEASPAGPEMWIASSGGATVAPIPVDSQTGVKTYRSENSSTLSDNVLRIAIGANPLRWFGTDKGIAAYANDKWLTPAYENIYPEGLFEAFPITAMSTNRAGDTLYVGTDGAGVARVYRNDVDGISGASVYAMWGPIIIPSDTIHSVFIAPDGTKWFGTNLGLAKHSGNNTLDNWTVYTTDEGLVNNDVQAIAIQANGNYWFGTKGGVSVFDHFGWTSYTTANGLTSNNVLCITVDKDDVVWLGTDNGVNCFKNGEFVSFK